MCVYTYRYLYVCMYVCMYIQLKQVAHTHRSLMLSDNLLTQLPPTVFSGLDVLRYPDTL